MTCNIHVLIGSRVIVTQSCTNNTWYKGTLTAWLLYAGSKIRLTSMISMAVELLAVLLGYKVFGQWTIKSEAEA